MNETEVDQLAIARELGSRIRPLPSRPTFGHFGLVQTVTDAKAAADSMGRTKFPTAATSTTFDRDVIAAFEAVRDRAPAEALLYDVKLQRRFLQACRSKGIEAPLSEVARLIQRVRKNPSLYGSKGLHLSKYGRTTHGANAARVYNPAVELALVRLHYRYGLSIDDVLLSPQIADEYESLVLEAVPHLSSLEVRKAALNLRKARSKMRKHVQSGGQPDLDLVKNLWEPHLSSAGCKSIPPSSEGLVGVIEDGKPRYIGATGNVQMTVNLFSPDGVLRIMEGPFWRPKKDSVDVHFLDKSELPERTSLQLWEAHLLRALHPTFNLPLDLAA